jgi:AraC-like DNA-binding protein
MLDELVDAVMRYTSVKGGPGPFATEIADLALLRSDQEKRPNHLILKPGLCIVVQGAKRTAFGNRRFEYRAGEALVISVEMPAMGGVIEASPAKPFLGLVLEFDLGVMREVMERLVAPPALSGDGAGGVRVTNFEGSIADCVLRMVRLLETPAAIPTIAPMIMRELCYWLLTGPDGGHIAQIALATSHPPRIIRAIHALRERFAERLTVDELAAIARLSPSAFHRQFKSLTSLTPLQYQKRLRLLDARRLMASGAANAETAAHTVGYESASQFSREYARMFGIAPRRDVTALRLAAA